VSSVAQAGIAGVIQAGGAGVAHAGAAGATEKRMRSRIGAAHETRSPPISSNRARKAGLRTEISP
jgi:hypothetical protein